MKRKHISLVTWYAKPNYGTTLQAYALYRTIERLGYTIDVLRYFRYPFNLLNIKDNIFSLLGIRRFWKYPSEPYPEKMYRIRRFCSTHMTERVVLSPISCSLMLDQTDILVAGSDQLWNCHDHFRPFEFLGFASGIKKISYGTSIGTADIPEQYHGAVRRYLSDFSSISLREQSGVDAIASLTGRKDVCKVLDPTFLVTADEWKHIASDIPGLPERYILCYLLADNKDYPRIVEQIRSQTGIKDVLIVPSGENPHFSVTGSNIHGDAGIEDFLRLLSGASLVVTDSFHGMALSINLSRDFIALRRFDDDDSSSQNSRIYDLFDTLGIPSRFYDGTIPPDIDYAAVQKTLALLWTESMGYLVKALS